MEQMRNGVINSFNETTKAHFDFVNLCKPPSVGFVVGQWLDYAAVACLPEKTTSNCHL